MAAVRQQECAIAAFAVRSAANVIEAYVRRTTDPLVRQAGARGFAFAIARTAAAARMVTHAEWACTHDDERDDAVARMMRWLGHDLARGLDAAVA